PVADAGPAPPLPDAPPGGGSGSQPGVLPGPRAPRPPCVLLPRSALPSRPLPRVLPRLPGGLVIGGMVHGRGGGPVEERGQCGRRAATYAATCPGGGIGRPASL